METVTLSTEEKKFFCKDCANLIGLRKALEQSETWKCGAKENEKGIDLVNGETTYKSEFCKSQRNLLGSNFCGIEGKWFKLYEYPKDLYQATASAKKNSGLNSLTLDDI